MIFLNRELIYSERELYPGQIINLLGEIGASAEEQSLVEQYLWSTFGGESVDL